MEEREGFNLSGYLNKTINELANVSNNDLTKIIEVPLSEIKPNRHQPRKHFDKKALEELANSIKENGVIQPIILNKLQFPEGEIQYEIVGGERRWRASQIAGKTTIPSIIRQLSDSELKTIALIENTQREDLTNTEKAISILNLKEEFNDIDVLSRYISFNKKTIEKYVRIGKAITANAEIASMFDPSQNIDFTLLHDITKYIEKLLDIEKSNYRVYYSIIKGLKKHGPTKNGLKYLERRFSPKNKNHSGDKTGIIACDLKNTERELIFSVKLRKNNTTDAEIEKINQSVTQFISALSALKQTELNQTD